MSSEIEVEYNNSLAPLEDLLSQVSRPGDFFMEGSREIPVPTISVHGIGNLSFPIPEIQIKALIQEASLAPYGRGEETILDTSIRKTWQISPSHLQISGKSWQMHFDAIVEEVKHALGCHQVMVSAELYKLLIYDEGSFFLPHRDSEKSSGMFGTMIIALPSWHEGGELIVRHKDHEARIDLSRAESSELKFAAFYADCEHEVLPIRKGYRVCLIYNLIQSQLDENQKNIDHLKAPSYTQEIKEISHILKRAFNEEDVPSKLVWLLEHQYSQVELSFDTLKNADAAIAKVLIKAAEQAKCAIHLGIVHIEESGSAEADFGYYSSKWRRGYHYEKEKDVGSADYEVIDICDNQQYIDNWISTDHHSIDLGNLPIEKNELLPCHALDGIEPDEQRLLEATGNAGVSFERAYHRAALILWPQENYIRVILQSGTSYGIAYFKKQMNLESQQKNRSKWLMDMKNMAIAIIDQFEGEAQSPYAGRKDSPSAEMLDLLCQLKDHSLIERFVPILSTSYQGPENDSLIATIDVLRDPLLIDQLFSDLFHKNVPYHPIECIKLYRNLTSTFYKKEKGTIKEFLKQSSLAILNGLKLLDKKEALDKPNYWKWHRRTRINSEAIVLLWHALRELNAKDLKDEIFSVFIANQNDFDPRTVLVPALAELQSVIALDLPLIRLWEYASHCLLAKSEHPPKTPSDWSQEARISCSCDDCKELKTFTNDPNVQIHRFQMPQQRRDHIANQLRNNNLDMDMFTDESRRPYTLVCTKTRKRYQAECKEYQADIQAMQQLIVIVSDLSQSGANEIIQLRHKLNEAVNRFNNASKED